MALYFRTLRSSSGGNCLMLWTGETCMLIDCGLNTQKLCRTLLNQHTNNIAAIDAVLISHLHNDHICYSALRVLQEHSIVVRIHEKLVTQFDHKHSIRNQFKNLKVKPFSNDPFCVGQLKCNSVKIPHSPQHDNYGFIIRYRHQERWVKIVIMTDFYDWDGLLDHFVDADFIYVEANHNPHLLKKYPNPNSHYHMKNENVADLLCNARKLSSHPPVAVMLGHLSKERNTKEFALQAIKDEFSNNSVKRDFKLYVAPADCASPVIKITD